MAAFAGRPRPIIHLATILSLLLLAPFTSAIAQDAAPSPALAAKSVEWRRLDPGFEVAELSIPDEAGGTDRLLLARVDPAKYRFVLRNDPAGHSLGDWMGKLGAVMVINGGFFFRDRTPATPMVSDGTPLGPTTYDARHGAFVASGKTAGIRDLRKDDWRQVFAKADAALVSFPLLLSADGSHSVQTSDKRAHRSFAGEDDAGRIVLGTTLGPSFTLPGFAKVLKATPLKLKLALNLDGGPYACQAVAHKDFTRSFCGTRDEPATTPDEEPNVIRRLPIALGVVPR
jgi:hypothetical protein